MNRNPMAQTARALRCHPRCLGSSGVVLMLLLMGANCQERLEPIEPIKIGVLVPQTGSLAGLGVSSTRAATLAAEQINSAGGLFDGRPLELVFADTETSPQGAENAANEILNEGIVAVLGPAASGPTAATLDLFAAESKPQISCCATSPLLTDGQTDQQGWFFRTVPDDRVQSQAFGFLAAQGYAGPHPNFDGEGTGEEFNGCPELIVVYRDDDYGRPLQEGLESDYAQRTISGHDADGNITEIIDPSTGTAAVGRILISQPYDSTFVDGLGEAERLDAAITIVEPIFERLRDAEQGHDETWNPQVCVALMSYGTEAAALLQAMVTGFNNYDDERSIDTSVTYLGSDGLTDSGFTTGGSLTNQVIVISPTHAENEAYEKYSTAYLTRFGSNPPGFTSQMFDATMLLGLAITSRESETGSDIRDALFEVSKEGQRFDGKFFGEMADVLLDGSDIDYIGPSGDLDFDASGNVKGDYQLSRVVSGSLVTTDYLPISEFIQ